MHRFLVGVLCCLASHVQAEGTRWQLRVGPAAVLLSPHAAPEAPPGTPVPGAGLTAEDGVTLGLEIGYEIAPSWIARLTLGVPITTDVSATGSIAPIGKAGSVTYGPGVLSVTRQLGTYGTVLPYAGIGAAYLVAFATEDAGVTSFRVKNAWGLALQVGSEFDLGPRYGLFLDVKKIFVATEVTGNVTALGGVPAYAKARVDPLVIQAGVTYRF